MYSGYRVFPEGKAAGRGTDPPPHLQCRGLKLGRATPLPALRAVVARKGGTFTFTNSETQSAIFYYRIVIQLCIRNFAKQNRDVRVTAEGCNVSDQTAGRSA